jgi:hypothetical protein
MKLRNRILTCALTCLLASAGLTSVVARAQKDAAPAIHEVENLATFVIYRNEAGEVACREATLDEYRLLMEPKPGEDLHLIYAGAPFTRKPEGVVESFPGRDFPTVSGSLEALPVLLPSAGLHIFLHGTSQLEANQEAKNAFIVAANRWEAIVSTPINLVFDVDYGPNRFGEPYPSPNILGSTGSVQLSTSFSTLRQRLIANSPTAAELQLYNALPASSVPIEGAAAASTVIMTRANARALGLSANITDPNALALGAGDAGIGFNSAFPFDFNPDNGISPGFTDFDAVVTHEIGHALGFVSNGGGDNTTLLTVWDVFRFRPSTASLATLATAPRVLAVGSSQVFFDAQPHTVGGATTQELGLSTGGPRGDAPGGDGSQSSHWRDESINPGGFIGIMDPSIAPGVRRQINNNDTNALDALGYSIGGVSGGTPENNNFVNAQAISGNTGSVTGSNVNATKEIGEPNHAGNSGGPSVWYSWQAPASGTATFKTANSTFDTLLAVYTGGSVGALTQIASNDDVVTGVDTSSIVVFNATAGTTYRIAVDGWNGATGNIVLNWNNVPPPPPNNNFASAQVITGLSGSVSGTNVSATKEVGEPNHAGNAGGTSVWYQWQAPSTGNVTFTTAGSNFDTLLGAYTGTSVGALTTRASNDDVVNGVDRTSIVVFAVTAGTTYRIAVDGWNSDVGSLFLNWSLVPACTYSISPTSQSFASGAGTGSVTVTAPTGCAWTAANNASFVTVTSGASGSGNGTVNYSVAANATASARSGTLTIAGATFTVNQAANTASSVQLSAATFGVSEAARKVLVSVTRTGSTAAAVSVDYATSDGTASRLRDYTQTLGTLVFAPGETTKTITVFVTDDVFAETAETFSLTLSNISGATLGSPAAAVVTINSDDATNGSNPVGDTAFNNDFFVRQHYVDFLGREADAGGLAFWTGEIAQCGTNAQCREVKKINVSAAFFLSIEFQNTGYLVYRFYKSAYGDATSPNVAGTVPVIRLGEFLPDTQRIGQNVVVNVGNWEAQLEANKQAYALEFVQRARFLAAFPTTMTPAQFVDKLRTNTGSALTQGERDQLVAELTANNTTGGRASVLRKVSEDATLQVNESNRAFVLMQYFGYLRRNPDDAPEVGLNFGGWKFWLDKLNQFNGNFVQAEMVKAFIISTEYRQRFGP